MQFVRRGLALLAQGLGILWGNSVRCSAQPRCDPEQRHRRIQSVLAFFDPGEWQKCF